MILLKVLFLSKIRVTIFTFFLIVICAGCVFSVARETVPVSVEAENGIAVPIIMYHSILNDPNKAGEYVVSQKTIENDIIYLIKNGYTTVVMQDLVNYVYKGTPLPDKPVILTFDDGYYNNLTYLLPLLEKYDCKAVISVVGRYTEIHSETNDENPNYSHLSWDNISELNSSGRIEIQNHSYDMHQLNGRKGSQKRKNESTDEYRRILKDDLSRLQDLLKENCGIIPNTYTYPYGAISDESRVVLEELGFKASLSCYEFINEVTRENGCLFGMGRFNRPSGISTNDFMKKCGI